MGSDDLQIDEIGPWSEIKLEIIRKYAAAYSTILAKQPRLAHIYVDAFAGAGVHRSRETDELVQGSPLVALSVKPRFSEYHFVDLNPAKASALLQRVKGEPNTYVYSGDCNDILLHRILPRCRYDDFRRALWLLDPNGLHYRWEIVEAAGSERGVEVFLNFPIMAINRDVARWNPARVTAQARERMTVFWGDETWRDVVYPPGRTLFDEYPHKAEGDAIVAAYCERLRRAAGFPYVPDPLLMTYPPNNAPLYYIVFASHNQTGSRIARDVFNRYRGRRA